MKSNNPVFNRSEEFNRASSNAYGNQTYAGGGRPTPATATPAPPSTWGTGTPGPQVDQGRMTVDSVVQKTAISLALVFAAAVATWCWTGDLTEHRRPRPRRPAADARRRWRLPAVAGQLVQARHQPGPGDGLRAAEGVALGAISKLFEAQFPGIVTSAVLGTFAAFAGTLAAYKFFDIKVGAKFRTFVIAGMFGMVGLGLLSLVLGLFGINTGLYGIGGLGFLFALAGLVLGVFMLILDFDFVENGVAAGLPERESWRAAFGLTVSLVWIYTNLLRILAIIARRLISHTDSTTR